MANKKEKRFDMFWIIVGVAAVFVLLLSIALGRFIGSYIVKKAPDVRVPVKITEKSLTPLETSPLLTPKAQTKSTTSSVTPHAKVIVIAPKSPAETYEEEKKPLTPTRTELAKKDVTTEGVVIAEIKPAVYRVQVGTFVGKENAEKLVAELKTKGYQPYLKKIIKGEEELYRVQVGAFSNKENAEKLAAELKNKGYTVFINQE